MANKTIMNAMIQIRMSDRVSITSLQINGRALIICFDRFDNIHHRDYFLNATNDRKAYETRLSSRISA